MNKNINKFSMNIKERYPGREKPEVDKKSKFYNKTFYNPDLDYEEEYNSHISIYGIELPDVLDFTDVWENHYNNYICPEYFYHFW